MSACKYEDYDWDELPKEVQDAAKTIGYNKKLWDKNKPAATDDYDWSELSPAQQEAAKVLGYTEQTWDAED